MALQCGLNRRLSPGAGVASRSLWPAGPCVVRTLRRPRQARAAWPISQVCSMRLCPMGFLHWFPLAWRDHPPGRLNVRFSAPGSRRVIEPAQQQPQKPRIRHQSPGWENVNAGRLEDSQGDPGGRTWSSKHQGVLGRWGGEERLAQEATTHHGKRSWRAHHISRISRKKML